MKESRLVFTALILLSTGHAIHHPTAGQAQGKSTASSIYGITYVIYQDLIRPWAGEARGLYPALSCDDLDDLWAQDHRLGIVLEFAQFTKCFIHGFR